MHQPLVVTEQGDSLRRINDELIFLAIDYRQCTFNLVLPGDVTAFIYMRDTGSGGFLQLVHTHRLHYKPGRMFGHQQLHWVSEMKHRLGPNSPAARRRQYGPEGCFASRGKQKAGEKFSDSAVVNLYQQSEHKLDRS